MSVMLFSACPTTIAQTTDLQIDQTEQITSDNNTSRLIYPETTEENLINAKTNVANVAVKRAPVWTSPTFEVLPSGKDIGIIHREYDYYYIQYESGGVTKRGYVSRSCTSTVVSTWCKHNIFDPGMSALDSAQNVYYCPTSNSAIIGTIDADEGISTNKPLIVLARLGNYYFIQYIANKSNNGSQHVQWQRGWVPINGIYVSILDLADQSLTYGTYYIQNVGTGRFLSLSDFNATNYSDIGMFDFEGDEPQKWTIELSNLSENYSDSNDSYSDYVLIKTCANNSSSTGRILSIRNALSVVNTQMELRNAGSPPSKDQEFYIKASGYTSADGSIEYNICSRLTGSYMQLGVYHDQQQEDAPVLNKYPYITMYNRWRLIPVGGTPTVRYVRLVQDASCFYSHTHFENEFSEAIQAFETKFGIQFRMLPTLCETFSSGLSCPRTPANKGCSDGCGDPPTCESDHHKSSKKLMARTGSSDYYTYKFVGHGLCNYDSEDSDHSDDVDGTAYISDYFAITTDNANYDDYDIALIIQHELSHNLGADDHKVSEGSCIMSDDSFNVWCNNCETLINQNIRNY